MPDVAIVPDTKDWTWVLREPCPECGMTAGDISLADVAPRVRASVPRWQAVLARPDVRDRPDESTWSPLEYACHVRDVCHLFDERLVLMLERDDPVFANWDQDVTAVEERYGEQDPGQVADELAAEAEAIAARFAAVRRDQWRPVRPAQQRVGLHGHHASRSTSCTTCVHHEHDVGATGETQ